MAKQTKREMLINGMINRVDDILKFVSDEFIVIKLCKLQRQLYKITDVNLSYVKELDRKISNILDDIHNEYILHKSSDKQDKMIGDALTQVIDVMETRIALEYVSRSSI